MGAWGVYNIQLEQFCNLVHLCDERQNVHCGLGLGENNLVLLRFIYQTVHKFLTVVVIANGIIFFFQGELEKLNAATNEINTLETEVDVSLLYIFHVFELVTSVLAGL